MRKLILLVVAAVVTLFIIGCPPPIDLEYELTVIIDGQGDVFKDPDREKYSHGEEVELEAFPHDGWEFSHWSGDIEGTERIQTLVMDEDKEATAHFDQIMHTITLEANPAEGGEVHGDGTYPKGTYVTVTAEAYENYTFHNWTEDGKVVHEQPEYSFYLVEDRRLVANFVFMPEP